MENGRKTVQVLFSKWNLFRKYQLEQELGFTVAEQQLEKDSVGIVISIGDWNKFLSKANDY